jgi:hypothetical protein
MLKKGKNGKIVMMYMDYTNEFLLSDRNLGLYAVDSFVFDLQRKEEAPHRSASVRIMRNLNPRYCGDDPASKGLAFTSYTRFEQAEPSQVHHPQHIGWDQLGSYRMHQPRYAGWEQLSPHHSESSWHQGSSTQWQDGNFNYYQQQSYEEVSSGFQGNAVTP